MSGSLLPDCAGPHWCTHTGDQEQWHAVHVRQRGSRALGVCSGTVLHHASRSLALAKHVRAQTMKLAGDGVEEQAEQVMRNMEAILAAAGCTFDDVVKTTVLCVPFPACLSVCAHPPRRLTDIKDFAAVNQIYGRRFPSNPPARSTFAVSALPLGAKVEIEAIAALR